MTPSTPPQLAAIVADMRDVAAGIGASVRSQQLLGWADRLAALTTPEPDAAGSVFDRAMKASWQMVTPNPTWAAGSYFAGQNNGMIAALQTVRENYDRLLAATPQSATPPAPVPAGEVVREPAPPHSLPAWNECDTIIKNHEFRQRAKAGLEGQVLDTAQESPEPSALVRFIHEYDDADRYRSAWFMHRLEQVLQEATHPMPASAVDGRDGGESFVPFGWRYRWQGKQWRLSVGRPRAALPQAKKDIQRLYIRAPHMESETMIDDDDGLLVEGTADDMAEALAEISADLGCDNTLDDILHAIAALRPRTPGPEGRLAAAVLWAREEFADKEHVARCRGDVALADYYGRCKDSMNAALTPEQRPSEQEGGR